MNNNKKTTRTYLTPETLEQAVGGFDNFSDIAEEGKKNMYINDVIRPEMSSIRDRMSQVSCGSEEYRKLQCQLQNLKSAMDGLTSNNQLTMISINSRMSNSDNCKKMIGDSAKAHADAVKSRIEFR